MALLSICLGFLVVLFDATAVNVATGPIGESTHASAGVLPWVLNAYTVTFAGMMLAAGSRGDRAGARRIYIAGAGIFTIASAVCAIAPTAGTLMTARAIQGIGAAAIVPCSLALIAHRFPAGSGRARALGVWGGVSGIGLTAGPVVGGMLVSEFGWQSVFLGVVPMTLLSIVLVAILVEEVPRHRSAQLDIAGQVFAVTALLGCTAALSEIPVKGWFSVSTVGLFGVTLVAGAGFVISERRTSNPMLPLSLLGIRPFSGAVGVGLLFNFSLYGVLFSLTMTLERTRELSAAQTGLVLLPLTAVVTISALLSGTIMSRYGPKSAMSIGLIGGLTGALLLALFGERASLLALTIYAGVLGLVGLAMPAMTSVALTGAGQRHTALGSAVLNAARQTGGALGIALLGNTSLAAEAGPGHLRTPLVIAATAYLLAIALTRASVPANRGPSPSEAVGPVHLANNRYKRNSPWLKN